MPATLTTDLKSPPADGESDILSFFVTSRGDVPAMPSEGMKVKEEVENGKASITEGIK